MSESPNNHKLNIWPMQVPQTATGSIVSHYLMIRGYTYSMHSTLLLPRSVKLIQINELLGLEVPKRKVMVSGLLDNVQYTFEKKAG